MSTRLLRLPEVADRYRVSTKTVRRALVKRDGSIAAPCMDRPYRWRETDIERHISSASLVEQRRTRSRRLRAVS